MSENRVLALAVCVTLLVGAALVWGGDDEPAFFATPVTAPEYEAAPEPPVLMDPEVLALLAAEPELIEQATPTTTSTTEPSTTTTLETTTTSATTTSTASPSPTTTSPSPTTAPAPTSPPTTQAPTTTAPSGGFNSGAESDFASRINSYRGSNGLSSLSRSGSLDSYARSWAKQMSDNGSLSHSNIGSLLGKWSSVGENLGVGGSVSSVFGALVNSSGHSQNMLGDFTHFGVGVYQDSDGTLWTCHVFAR